MEGFLGRESLFIVFFQDTNLHIDTGNIIIIDRSKHRGGERGTMSVKDIDKIIKAYIDDVRECLGSDFRRACVYGSYARGEYGEDSDIDIAIFTDRKPGDFYLLINLIAEITFEYNVKYNIILSPVFQNEREYERMLKVVPYYQSIQREGIAVG